MLKKLVFAFGLLLAAAAFAQVDVNKADQAGLDGVKGIGPKMSQAILAERKKNGDFKNWSDFQKRVKGIGDKNAAKLSHAGLVVNGQAMPNAPAGVAAKPAAAAARKPDTKPGAAK